MTGDVLLDTNIVIGLFANDAHIVEQLKTIRFYLPAPVVGELYAGAYKSGRAADNVGRVDALVASSTVLNCDAHVAKRYGLIKQELRIKGRPIPENDLWIAAIARQYGLTLITRDNHFSFIDNLAVESW